MILHEPRHISLNPLPLTLNPKELPPKILQILVLPSQAVDIPTEPNPAAKPPPKSPFSEGGVVVGVPGFRARFGVWV